MLDVLARVVAVLLRKHHVSEGEVQEFVSQIKERHMSDLFANFKATINVMEERKIGQGIGEEIKLIKMIGSKLQKGWSPEQIAELFEEDLDYIKEISEVASKYAPSYDADKIYGELHNADSKEDAK